MRQPTPRPATLTRALAGDPSLARQVAMVLAGSLLVAASAQVSVPMYPVPMTLQTLAISLIGLTYGARLAAITLAVYLVQGALGLPVFAGGAATLPYMMGPTGGFLFGFVAMAFVAGLLAERGLARGLVGTAFTGLLASIVLYIPGVVWLDAATGLDFTGAIGAGMTPFLLGDAVKIAIAALAVTGAWSALGARRG